MQIRVRHAAKGFIEHGHLFGHHAFVVEPDEAGLERSVDGLVDEILRSKMERVHIVVPRGGMHESSAVARGLGKADPTISVSMAFLPGETAMPDRYVYEGILVIPSNHVLASSELDCRAGSVHLGHWPGAPTLGVLTCACDAPYGYFLVLKREDIGHAKVWMQFSGDSHWQIIPYHPLNHMFEGAEIDQSLDARAGEP